MKNVVPALLATSLASTSAFVSPATSTSRVQTSPSNHQAPNTKLTFVEPGMRNHASPESSSALSAGLNIDAQTTAYAAAALHALLGGAAFFRILHISDKVDEVTKVTDDFGGKAARIGTEIAAALVGMTVLNVLHQDYQRIEFLSNDFNRMVVEDMRMQRAEQQEQEQISQSNPESAISDEALATSLKDAEPLN